MSAHLSEPLAVTLLVIDALQAANVPYVVVGSMASAQHGAARSTLDTDLVVVLKPSHIPGLIAQLQTEFYADEQMAMRAVENRSSFNLIHLKTMFKVDLFVAGEGVFDRAQIERRVVRKVAEHSDRTIFVLSAEDTILAKLRWYRMGGEQSSRQWDDVVSVVKVQGDRLDIVYLRAMAAELQVDDLLRRLLQ